jgi:pyruvate,orthophosphate dikinase
VLGFRGCRLSIIHPHITEMQTRAAIGAALDAQDAGFTVNLKLMIPLISTDHEIEEIAPVIRAVAKELFDKRGKSVPYDIGTMIEVPRACLRADAIAKEGDINFVSFGTNDLTQMTYGFSRDDSDRFLPYYLQKKII